MRIAAAQSMLLRAAAARRRLRPTYSFVVANSRHSILQLQQSQPLLSPAHGNNRNAIRTFADHQSTLEDDDVNASPATAAAVSTTASLPKKNHQRVWHAVDNESAPGGGFWHDRVMDHCSNNDELDSLLTNVADQEFNGGRMKTRQLGVLHEDPAQDMQLLTSNYTVHAVASALRDREDALQQAAVLADQEDWEGLQAMLRIYHPRFVAAQRMDRGLLDLQKAGGLDDSAALEVLRKALMRMPRTVTQAHAARAAVVVALCTVDGVPSLLLEKRAAHLRAHPDEVCLPGGMVCAVADKTIVATCLREMEEEIAGIDIAATQVLGVFRCNWGEVHHLVGVAVTPVVCFLGELPENLQPNPSEVSQVFTLPLDSLMDKSLWEHKEGHAPMFLGAPEPIWGLTGYILDRFRKDILLPNSIQRKSEKKAANATSKVKS